MRIYIKSKKHRSFLVPVPSVLARMVLRPSLGSFIKRKAMEKADEKSKAMIAELDFRALFESLHCLFEYKGLRLVEVCDGEGNEVRIII